MKKFMLISCIAAGFALFGADTVVNGNFPAPRKPGMPPAAWTKLSRSKGTLEVISTGNANSVKLTCESGKNNHCGIVSPAIPAKASDVVEISAKISGSKTIALCVFQYSDKGSSSLRRKLVYLTDESKEVKQSFTVGDSAKGKTKNIRAVFYIYSGSEAAISAPKVTMTPADGRDFKSGQRADRSGAAAKSFSPAAKWGFPGMQQRENGSTAPAHPAGSHLPG